MRIVVKKVGQAPEVREIIGTLENIQKIVGGYIECFPVFDNVLCVCNEEGKLLGLPANFKFGSFGNDDTIVGDVFFCAVVEDEFASLSGKQVALIMTCFEECDL